MGRIWLAIRAFFRVLFDAELAGNVQSLLGGDGSPSSPHVETPKQPVEQQPKPKSARSEALTLLAALQREARLVDFIREPIDAYNDAQVGAAVREVHRQSAAVLERLFDLKPVVSDEEGQPVDVPSDFDASRFRLTGNVVGQPPHRGKLVHAGWEAAKCELPAWTGGADAARVVAPAEVELQ